MWELKFQTTREVWNVLELVVSEFEPAVITTSCGDIDLFDNKDADVKAPGWKEFQVSLLFTERVAVESLYSALGKLEPISNSLEKIKIREDIDWSVEWKKNWVPRVLSSGLYISPSWLKIPAHVTNYIRIDPGQAFGTGSHETTKMCLDYLDECRCLKDFKIIDYGCGSGILSLVAAARGCQQVTATDKDLEALEIAKKNVVFNCFEEAVKVVRPELLKPLKSDLLVANILLETLLALKPTFSDLVRKGGLLVLSGIMTSQSDSLISSYCSEFLNKEIKTCNDWSMLVFSKK